MQQFPGVPPVGQVPTPGRPAGPNLTQYPTAPPSGFVPPSIQFTPGPATIAGSPVGPSSPGGVAGVQMAGVPSVAMPAMAGGPHQLPPFPSFPLPQGFPNPFATGPLAMGGQGASPGAPGQTVTGPQGYFPGIGWLGQQGAGGAPQGMPPMAFGGGGPPMPFPGAAPQGMPPMAFGGGGPPMPFPGAAPPGMPPMAFGGGGPPMPFPGGAQPGMPPMAFGGGGPPMPYPGGAQPGMVPTAYGGGGAPMPFPGGAPARAPEVVAAGLPASAEATRPGPFWLHLAWQLLQTPAVRESLGELFDQLVRGPNRIATIQAAANALTDARLQEAFQRVTAGQLDQSAFTQLFADQLKRLLTEP